MPVNPEGRLTIDFPIPMTQRIKALAEGQGMSVAAVMRMLVRDGIEALEMKLGQPAPGS